MSKLLEVYKFTSDVVDGKALEKEITQGKTKYPNARYQLRLYEKSHSWGSTTCIQLCWYSK